MDTRTLPRRLLRALARPGLAVGALVALTLLSGACDDKLEPLPLLPAVRSTTPAGGASEVARNTAVTATFIHAMDASTINTTTFTLRNGATLVPAAVSYAGVTGTLIPTSTLAENTEFTATISTGVQNVAGENMAILKTWKFTTAPAPVVISTSPANAAVAVARNTAITATFSEAMTASTINATTFTLQNGVTAVPGVVSYAGVTATLVPASLLAANTVFTVTISTGAQDLSGDGLVVPKVWTFTTSGVPTVPTVLSTNPASAATGVSRTSAITVTFSEAMDPATLTATTFTLRNGLIAIPGVVTRTATTATLTPSGVLAANTLFTATVSTGARNVAGVGLAPAYSWNFTTVAASVPTVISTVPADAATGINRDANITATFSEAMTASTINGTTFTLRNGATAVPAAVSYAGVTATLNPTATLAASTVFTATISTGAQDLDGDGLATAKVWTFTTAAATAGPAIVNLGSAINYVILAKSAVSTTGASSVVGNIGLSPAAASFITGFALSAPPTTFTTSALVTGQVFAADYDPPTPTALNTAVLDMQAAYTDAAGRTLPDFTELGAGNIQGLTLVPGLYKWGTGVQIPSAVTLSGGANDVWIFQIGQDLTVGNGAIVTLAGGAQARNVFWQVAGTASLGTTADFKGIILSQTLISMNTGAVVLGRVLAQTAVTLNATAITQP